MIKSFCNLLWRLKNFPCKLVTSEHTQHTDINIEELKAISTEFIRLLNRLKRHFHANFYRNEFRFIL